MDAATLMGFVAVSIVGIATPGPDVLLTIRNGARHGVFRSCAGIAGVAFSDLFIMACVAFGLGAVLAASEIFYFAAKLMGVAYLSYLGLRLMLLQAVPMADGMASAVGQYDWSTAIFARSFLVAFTNVKVWLFFAAFLPQFVQTTEPQIPQYMSLALVFETLNIAILVVYAWLGAYARSVFQGQTAKWLDRVSGAFLLCLAVTLMVHQQHYLP